MQPAYARFVKYKYVFRAVGCFPGPYLANSFNRSTHNAKHYSSQLWGTCSSTVIAAVVIAIAHVPYQRKKNILTSRAVFAHHFPKIGGVNGNRNSTGCVRGGREEYVIILSFFIHL